MSHKDGGGGLIQYGWCPYNERMWHQGSKGQVKRPSEKAAIYKPRKEASEETKSAYTLTLNFQPPELWKNKSII